MADGYGNTSRNVFAFFDPDTSSWKTSTPSLFPGETDDGGDRHRSKRSLVTWPRSGMTRAGEACELRTWAPATDENVSSSLLPTPCPAEPGGTVEQYHERLRKSRPGTPTFTPLAMLVQLLATADQAGDATPPLSPNGNRPVVDVPLPPWTDGDSSPPSSSNG